MFICSTASLSSTSECMNLIKWIDADCLIKSSTPLIVTTGKWIRILDHWKGTFVAFSEKNGKIAERMCFTDVSQNYLSHFLRL